MTRLAWRFAKRELRGGLYGLRLLIACLILGVAALAGVGSLSQAILAGLESKGQVLLGGDLELRLTNRAATPSELVRYQAIGQLSQTARLRAMAKGVRSNERLLSELKAVDARYPLYGMFLYQDARGVQQQDISQATRKNAQGLYGAVIDPLLAERLRVRVGDSLQLGDGLFYVGGLIAQEPDRASEGFALGPSVLIAFEALPSTGLAQPGSLVRYHYRIATPPGSDIDALSTTLKTAYPQADWRLLDRRNGAPGVRRFVDQLGQFLTLVGLTALMVSGVGVANAVSAYLARKTSTIATLKALGAPSNLIFQVYLIQIALVCIGAIGVGLVVGAFVPQMMAGFLSSQLPVPPLAGLYPAPLALAALFGLLVGLSAALWPLAQARAVPAARLFRASINGIDRAPARRYLLLIGVMLASVIALAVLTANVPLLAFGVVCTTALMLLVLRALAFVIKKTAARLPRPKAPLARLALGNLHRPGAVTAAVITALGLGLTLFGTLAVVEANIAEQVRRALPARAPAFFFLDIPQEQASAFEKAAQSVPGTGAVKMVPSLRGIVTALKGVSVQDMPPPKDDAWFVRGDRQLAYFAYLPEGNSITAGKWWPKDYQGPPLVSLDEEIARSYGLKVGDRMTVSVLGVEITATIANLRRIDWESLGFNFALLFDPAALVAAPHSFMATVEATPQAEAVLYKKLTNAFPTAAAIRFKEIANSVVGVLDQVSSAVRATATVTILAGVLVLIGAMAASQQSKTYDAVLLKVLGANRGQILRAYLLEYAVLGTIAGFLAVLCGMAAGWFVVTQVLEAKFVFTPLPLLATIAAGAILTVLLGLVGTWAALRARPNQILRLA
jgi:putative ABC transport system permease protein